MQDHPYRWVIVAAGGVMGCIVMGALFALPVLLTPMTEASGWSRAGISGAMTIAFLAMSVMAMIWGALYDRFGPRPVVATGIVLFALGLFLAGRAPTLLAFQLSFGLVAGGSVGAAFTTMALVMGWFTRQRGLAISLVSAGMGLAPVTMSPLAAALVASYDWRMVLTLLALVCAVVCLPLTLLLRPAPPQAVAAEAAMPDAPPSAMTVLQAVTSPQFIVLVLTNFFCCATHSGPIFHTVSYAELCGIAAMTAVTIYSVEGIAGMGGRIGFGLLGDRFGARRVLATGLMLQAFGALGYYFARDLWAFYAVAAFFGFIYAGIMPLYNVLVRENFPMKMLGTIMGGMGMAGSLGMASGPVLGGWIFDATGSYGGMYLTCFGMGLAAFAVAMTFRPFRQGGVAAVAA